MVISRGLSNTGAIKLYFGMRAVLLIATALLLTLIMYYGVVFQGSLPDHSALKGKNDLFLHFGAFLALTLTVRLWWPRWSSILSLMVIATVIEVLQVFEPRRTAAFEDLAASALSIAVGSVLFGFLTSYLLPQIKDYNE